MQFNWLHRRWKYRLNIKIITAFDFRRFCVAWNLINLKCPEVLFMGKIGTFPSSYRTFNLMMEHTSPSEQVISRLQLTSIHEKWNETKLGFEHVPILTKNIFSGPSIPISCSMSIKRSGMTYTGCNLATPYSCSFLEYQKYRYKLEISFQVFSTRNESVQIIPNTLAVASTWSSSTDDHLSLNRFV